MSLNITVLKQTRSTNCGQTAVAMLTGRTIREVEKVYGHGHCTYPKEHTRAVRALGYYPDERGFQTYTKDAKLPEVALVRLCCLKRTRNGKSWCRNINALR